MAIGVVPETSSGTGGIYQYSVTMLTHLSAWNDPDGFVVFAEDRSMLGDLGRERDAWSIRPLHPPSAKQVAKRFVRSVFGDSALREIWEWRETRRRRRKAEPEETVRHRPGLRRWFLSAGVELMLYPSSTAYSFECGIPYVMGIPDLQHRLQPEFPEVSEDGEFEAREYLYRNGTRFATLVFADSEVGREDILQCYGDLISEDRVKVLPYLPAPSLNLPDADGEAARVGKEYALPERYLFYPAQFWPHKNHLRIVQALRQLKEDGLRTPMIFCGSRGGRIRQQTFEEVMRFVQQFGLEEEVRYLGYVPDKNMAGLYRGATALIFPTFFGPTNIPVLEAWSLDCPVLSSNIRGIREQVGEGGILVDPRSVEELADGIRRLWVDEEMRGRLAGEGRRRLATYTPADYDRSLAGILREARERIRSERTPGP